MSIEQVGPYSRDIVYGQLTSPFNEKAVTINAHTPYDKADGTQESFSMDDFFKNLNTEGWKSAEDIRNIKVYEPSENLSFKVGIDFSKFPPESSVSGFQVSNLQNDTGIVLQSIKNGFSADQAIKISRANKAYSQILDQDSKNETFAKSLKNKSYPSN